MAAVVEEPSPETRRPRRRDAALAQWRRARAVELAQSGMGYDEIAREIGLANRGTAWRYVNQALRERVVEGVDELREVELERLTEIHRAWSPRALEGDRQAALVVLRALEQRVRLLWLDRVEESPQGPISIVVGPGRATR